MRVLPCLLRKPSMAPLPPLRLPPLAMRVLPCQASRASRP